jgi:methionyl-tRNA formyltransferase
MQAFQMFHDTTAESSDLYNCKHKDRETLQNFVKRFMQQRSQIPEADDKTTIKALIKGLTPGPTASHLTEKTQRRLMNFFMKLKITSCLMMIIAEEWLNEMKRDKAT